VIRITDSTLRDGSHALSHSLDPERVRSVVRALDGAGVPVIEVSHGDGLGGSSFNYGFSSHQELELVRAAAEAVDHARVAVLLLPGIGVAEDLVAVREAGATVARIATHCTEADIAEQHIRQAKELGMEAVGFLMMAHMSPPEALADQGALMESYGADCVYVVDSAGALTIPEAAARVSALREQLRVEIGFHAHNNLSLAVANSVVAVEYGATQLDACLCGLGAGAGNCPEEVLVAVCEKLGIQTGVDPLALMDAAEEARSWIPRAQVIDRSALLLGYAGVYSSFLLHAERAAERYGVDAKEILIDLGRRRVVGGQEDMIIDVAVELARQNGGRVSKRAEEEAVT